MPLVNQADSARKIISEYRDSRISMPCFCAENTFTMEGILKGASRLAEEREKGVAIYIAVTGNYHGRQQLRNYTSLDNTWEGYLAFKSDIERLCRKNGPFPNVNVIPSLDHGQPEIDSDIIDKGRNFWGCVMFDCSTLPLDDNRRMVKDFVKKYRDYFVIEGCVDEITESGQGGMKLTDPDQAKRYMEETGTDLIVANLGTEHRVTGDKKKYRGDIARQIYERIGYRIVLHGTSCLTGDDIVKLPSDGIAKVNIWTILETKTTQQMLVNMIRHAEDILPAQTISELVDKGLLGNIFSETAVADPKLEYLTEVYRRNQIKVPEISQAVYDFMKVFGY